MCVDGSKRGIDIGVKTRIGDVGNLSITDMLNLKKYLVSIEKGLVDDFVCKGNGRTEGRPHPGTYQFKVESGNQVTRRKNSGKSVGKPEGSENRCHGT